MSYDFSLDYFEPLFECEITQCLVVMYTFPIKHNFKFKRIWKQIVTKDVYCILKGVRRIVKITYLSEQPIEIALNC